MTLACGCCSTVLKGVKPVSELRIVQAGIQHLDVLTPLFDAYRVFYKQASDEAAARAYLHARLSGLEAIVFLAFSGDEPAGFTLLYPSFSSVSLGRAWLLNDLFVTSEARGRGVGEALLERAATFGEQTDADKLTLQTQVENETAQRLYERSLAGSATPSFLLTP